MSEDKTLEDEMIDVPKTTASLAVRELQLFDSSSGAAMLVRTCRFGNREDVVKHCIRKIDELPIEAGCLLARKEQLGECYEPIRELAVSRLKQALALLTK